MQPSRSTASSLGSRAHGGTYACTTSVHTNLSRLCVQLAAPLASRSRWMAVGHSRRARSVDGSRSAPGDDAPADGMAIPDDGGCAMSLQQGLDFASTRGRWTHGPGKAEDDGWAWQVPLLELPQALHDGRCLRPLPAR